LKGKGKKYFSFYFFVSKKCLSLFALNINFMIKKSNNIAPKPLSLHEIGVKLPFAEVGANHSLSVYLDLFLAK
jgi:hypothetical protein